MYTHSVTGICVCTVDPFLGALYIYIFSTYFGYTYYGDIYYNAWVFFELKNHDNGAGQQAESI